MKYSVRKSVTIDAPQAKIRALIEDFNQWNRWSPWTIAEPECPIEISGEPGVIGHSMMWDGEIIGSGRNTLNSIAANEIAYDLAFFKPWKSEAEARFQFEDSGEQTKVTWCLSSSMPWFLFFMIKTMKNWIGMDYERGLRMLKALAETGEINAKTTNNGLVDYQGFSYVGLKRSVAIDEVASTMQEDFDTMVKLVVIEHQTAARHWVTIYPKFDMRNLRATYIVAVSDENLRDKNLDQKFIRGQIPTGKMLEVKHDGPYDFLGNAWAMGMMTMRAKKHKGAKYPFEQYWNSPLEEAPENLRTSVYFPIKG